MVEPNVYRSPSPKRSCVGVASCGYACCKPEISSGLLISCAISEVRYSKDTAQFQPNQRVLSIRNANAILIPHHPRFRNLHSLRYVASRLLPKRTTDTSDASPP